MVHDGDHQAGPQRLALVQGDQTVTGKRQVQITVRLVLRDHRWRLRPAAEGERYLQLEGLVEKRVEVAAFDLGATRLHFAEDVVRLQTQLHKWITETWRGHQSVSKGQCHVSLVT